MLDRSTQYGKKFLGPVAADAGGEYYLAAGPDGLLGTADDLKVVSRSTFPDDLTTSLATGIKITVPDKITNDSNRVKPAQYYDFSAVVMNGSQPSVIQDITWSLEGNPPKDAATKITQEGVLHIGGNEPIGAVFTVQAKTIDMDGGALTKTVTVTVRDWDYSDLMSAPVGTTTTVEIDGMGFYLLAKNGDQGLLWATNMTENSQFGTSVNYEGSTAQSKLHTWVSSKSTLNRLGVPYTIYARKAVNSQEFIASVDQKAFLLSEADLFGTTNQKAALPDDYTFNGKQLVNGKTELGKQMIQLKPAGLQWLRSLWGSYGPAVVRPDTAGFDSANAPNNNYALRPALWVDLSASIS